VSARLAAACLVWALFLGGGWSVADDQGDPVVVTLTDGGRLVGVIVRETAETLTLRTTAGLELELPRETVGGVVGTATAAQPSATVAAESSDPNDTRLMFAPTGRPLGKGNGYFSDYYVVFPGFAYGLTDHLSLSGGFSVVPGLNFEEQVFYVSSTVGWRLSTKAAFSLGGLYATGSEASESGALLFGVASFGSSERSLSVGVSLAATRNDEYLYDAPDRYSTRSEWHWREAPILMVGGTVKAGKRVSLVAESWLFPGHDFQLSEQPLGVAVRFFGERLSVDVGVVLVAEVLDEGFPIPWLSFSYHFGPSRTASKQRGLGTLPRLDYGGSRRR